MTLDYSFACCSFEIAMFAVCDYDYICIFKVCEGWKSQLSKMD